MTFAIRPTRAEDAPFLPAVERSAGDLFRTIPGLEWIADGDDLSVERYLEIIAHGASWVAESPDGSILAFLCAQVMGEALHIWEFGVALDQQRRGIGRALMGEAIGFARRGALRSITLTTFRDVAWNEPAYHRVGFATLPPDQLDERLSAILLREGEAGLPPEQRCAMRLVLG